MATAVEQPGALQSVSGFLSRERLVIYSGAILAMQLIQLGIWAFASWVLHLRTVPPLGLDFRVFWSASFVSLHSGMISAFNPDLMAAVEAHLYDGTNFADAGHFAPWVYPPPFHALILPLALLPYAISYTVYCFMCIAMVLFACRSAMASKALPWITVIAFPGIWVATIHGQNSLITLSLAAISLAQIKPRPVLAGVCAGALLAVKPQLGLLLPLFFLCARQFRAVAAAAATVAIICSASAFAFGLPLWGQFFGTLSWFNSAILTHNYADLWRAMPTIYAIARSLGANLHSAYAMHLILAGPLVVATAILWSKQPGSRLSSAAAIVATLTATPYLIQYDLVWLLLPVLYLCEDFQRTGHRSLWESTVVALAWFLPIPAFLGILMGRTEWGGVLLPVLLLTILTRAFVEHQARDGGVLRAGQ
ncbi:glycosyltransferase family 87 protein [Paraburkholderia heleia]|uniref:glycosyltransferase family 87 protein n=1 Tax=Paraburkholderia heleia TaxID=634127 RepID=UPI000AE7C85F|nr:glycosyltransferase family 87 protein [Paraburkholderia heleia]